MSHTHVEGIINNWGIVYNRWYISKEIHYYCVTKKTYFSSEFGELIVNKPTSSPATTAGIYSVLPCYSLDTKIEHVNVLSCFFMLIWLFQTVNFLINIGSLRHENALSIEIMDALILMSLLYEDTHNKGFLLNDIHLYVLL